MRHRALAWTTLLLATGLRAEMVRTEIKGLRMTIPSAWGRVPASSDFRAAQFRISHVAPDTEDGEFVVFYFGKGQGGGVEDNLERWYGQFLQTDGKPTKEKAVVTTRTVAGLKVTEVDVSGTYKGMGPAAASAPKPNTRMLAAIVEGGEGPWILRATGPEHTMGSAKSDFDAMLLSVEEHR